MRDYLITIATATLAAMLLQIGSPPACAVTVAPLSAAEGK
ncbi:hypothetical protein SPMU_15400 [Sphingomonas mucosissima]|jgi:hypothetical protein|uniref:Uncharacterized protein n=1 Tax=Sphingomonas mucosissima TaxID=370959 RepID=A0A245ZLG8_9SPHN|nr:hypothetical protein SPMU_15400 [Sphingomonas mucosissima]